MEVTTPLGLWRDVEMFQPFDLDEVLVVEENAWHISLSAPLISEVPWVSPESWGLSSEYDYGYDLFIGIFEKECSHDIVEKLGPAEDITEPFDERRDRKGLSCVLRLGVNTNGELLIEDSRISTLPWALTRLQEGCPLLLDTFDTYGRDLLLRILSAVSLSPDSPFTDTSQLSPNQPNDRSIRNWTDISRITKEAHEDLLIPWGQYADRFVLVAHRLRKKKVPEESSSEDAQPPHSSVLAKQTALSSLTEGFTVETTPTAPASVPRIRRRCEILNSFLLRDLQRVAQQYGKLGKHSPLSRYLSGKESSARMDLAHSSDTLWRAVAPSALPLGRWPHPEGQVNSLMQQVAINEFMSGRHPLFSVNGPPGTGKTTLVKDVIAATIVQRALALVRHRKPDDAFDKQRVDCELDRTRYSLRRLKKDIIGFEIVVASSNNSAVENITRELPKITSLGDSFINSRYLPEIINLYHHIRTGREKKGSTPQLSTSMQQPSPSQTIADLWGLISIPLGNRVNRELFMSALLFGPPENKDEKQLRVKTGRYLTLPEWRKRIIPEGTITYSKARLLFLEAQKNTEEAILRAQKSADSSPAISHRNFDSREVQEQTPWVTKELQHQQSKLFLAALVLHESWLREVSGFKSNLSALGKFLSRPEAFEPATALILWQTLSMIVPVFSTTLASVERMCAALGEQSIGTVILEEAGQATPQSAVGILWRARRALVIGDPMQIPPVISTPQVLIRHFMNHHKVEKAIFSPLSSSTQSLADESNPLGTWLDNAAAKVWVGCPLRVHRRCIEPMFSIANTIAYGGLMTYGTSEESDPTSPLGALPASCWFDISGNCADRHFVPEQGTFVLSLLHEICAHYPDLLPDLFMITPFRSVRERLSRLVTSYAKTGGISAAVASYLRKRIGTIHTFQGKEADIVILVLGCDDQSRGAARWAGQQPNILNVAVTRARKRVYAIGSLALWHNQGYFSELAANLPRASIE